MLRHVATEEAALLGAEAFFGSAPNERMRTVGRWALFLFAATLAGCLTPYGYEPLLINFKLYGGQSVENIREWAPLSARNDPVAELLLVFLTFLALYFGVRIHFWRLVIIVLLLHLTFLHVRLAALFGLTLPLLIASSLTTQFRFTKLETHIEDDPDFFKVGLRLARPSVFLLLGSLILAAAAFHLTQRDISPAESKTPTAAVDYIESNGLKGHIYNDFSFGGYLIFRGLKTFIDGRIDQIFTGGFLDRYVRISNGYTGSAFQQLLKEFDISLVLVKPDSPEALYMDQEANWTKLYGDNVSVLYGKQ